MFSENLFIIENNKHFGVLIMSELNKQLTELDKQILEALQKDGRMSYTELAERFNANVSTISYRVQRLTESGILKIVGVVNPFKTGNSLVADIKLQINLFKLDSAILQLNQIQEVRFIAACTGTHNLLIEVYTTSSGELYQIIKNKIGKIEGVENIETSILLEVHKQSYDFGVNIDE